MIDLTPFTGFLLELLVLVLIVVLVPAAKRLFDKLGLDKDSEIRFAIDAAIHTAIGYAVDRAGQRIPKEVETRNEFVRVAASYVIDRFPDAMRHFNLGPEDIAEMVRARLWEHESEVVDVMRDGNE